MADQSSKGLQFLDEEDAAKHLSKLYTSIHHGCNVEKKPESCHQLAEYHRTVKKDYKTCVELLENNCFKVGFGDSCFQLGNMYIIGKGMEKSFKKALQLLNKACDMKVMGACNNAGLVHQSNKDMPKAIEMFETACRGNLSNSCFNLSAVHLAGLNGVPKNMEKAFEYSLKSCELGHSWGCANVGRMYSLGEGVDQDAAMGKVYQKKAKDLMQGDSLSSNP